MNVPQALDAAELAHFALPRQDDGDKESHGRILIIAGSRDVPGAPLLTAHAAMRVGAGKLQLAVPRDIAVPLGVAMPEAKVVGLASAADGGFEAAAVERLVELAKGADAIVAGPAMTANAATAALAGHLLALGKPLALDAALLHALPALEEEARGTALPPLLLPHTGEMASLLDCANEEVDDDPLGCGRNCARRYGAMVLVKGVQSHVVAPDGRAWKYQGGTPGLGVSGSGDVLAGIAGGLLARGTDPLTALLWSVWLHGEAGSALAGKIGAVGFLARELPGELPGLLPA